MFMLTALLADRVGRTGVTPVWHPERGQATAEYAIVIVGAAAVAALVLAWAAGTGKITRLLNAVLDAVIGQVG